MKRKILLLFALIFVSLVLVSCNIQINVDLKTVLEDVNTQYKFEDMKILGSKDELNQYYLIEPDDVVDFAAEISTDSSDMTELIFVKAIDKSSASDIATCLNNYYQTRVDMANSYDAEYAQVLSKCSVEQNGVYVSLIIDDNADEIKRIYNSYFE